MHILPLHDSHISNLYKIYRDVTARAAHCRLKPSLSQFTEALATPKRPETHLIVAEQDGVASGFAALLALPTAEDGTTRATISALFVADETAGQALLDACVQMAQNAGVQRLDAFSADHFRCPVPGYNVGWDSLSDTMPIVARLLARNGFTPTYRELLLKCDLRRFSPVALPPPAGVTIERRVPEEGGWDVVPFLNGQRAGACSYGTLDRMVDDPDAARVGYVWGIGVAETARRRGIARFLMSHLLTHLQEIGCDECWLGTGAANWSAQPLYLSLGFEIVDGTASFRLVLR